MMNEEYNKYKEYESTIISEEEVPKKKSKRHRIGKKIMALALSGILVGSIGGASFQGIQYISNKVIRGNRTTEEVTLESKDQTSDVPAVTTSTGTTDSGGDVSEVVENVLPSIVSIRSSFTVSTNVFGRAYEEESQGSGSGFIIGQNNSEVLVVTNNHVIDSASTVEVVFSDETTVTAEVKGTDTNADLAVISINLDDLTKETIKTIRVATLGDSEELKVGEMAIAIGNALGYGQSVTVGYISAKERQVSLEDSAMVLLQTDAAINPGNSGGALINSKGQVIGINSMKYASEEVEGMGYAIPISDAIPIINELMNREEIPEAEQAYLGIKGQDVTESYAERFQMPVGIYIGEVSKDSPAEKAGITATSIITGINGKKVTTFEKLQEVLSYTKANEKAVLTVQVFENGQYIEKEIEVTLGSKSDRAK